MSYTAVGTTTFVLGSETNGNREIRVVTSGELYDIDPLDNTAYTLDATEFPVV